MDKKELYDDNELDDTDTFTQTYVQCVCVCVCVCVYRGRVIREEVNYVTSL
jgi:hypothetical protein